MVFTGIHRCCRVHRCCRGRLHSSTVSRKQEYQVKLSSDSLWTNALDTSHKWDVCSWEDGDHLRCRVGLAPRKWGLRDHKAVVGVTFQADDSCSMISIATTSAPSMAMTSAAPPTAMTSGAPSTAMTSAAPSTAMSKRPASRLERRAESLASPRDEAWLPGGAWNATPRSLPSLERKIRSRTHA